MAILWTYYGHPMVKDRKRLGSGSTTTRKRLDNDSETTRKRLGNGLEYAADMCLTSL